MKTVLTILVSTILLVACNNASKEHTAVPPNLFTEPLIIPFSLEGGYKINALTGDSIRPILNFKGDTILSGIQFPATGRRINKEEISKPEVTKNQLIKNYLRPLEKRFFPEPLPKVLMNQDSVRRIVFENKETTISENISNGYFHINSTGDTIPVGIPVILKGKIISCKKSAAKKGFLPRIKENANYNVRYMDIDEGLNSSDVTSVLEDKRGNIWLGTNNGVSMYNGVNFTHYTTENGLSSNHIVSILEDKSGNLWFATDGGGVTIFNGKHFTHYTEDNGLSNNRIFSIIEDEKGNIWLGTVGGGVVKFDGKHFTHYNQTVGLFIDYILCLFEDKNGNIWMGGAGGITIFDGSIFTHLTKEDGLSWGYISSILENDNGDIWIGTRGGGLNIFDGQGFTQFSDINEFGSKDILNLQKMKNGNIWMSINGKGVLEYDGHNYRHLSVENGLSTNTVNSFYEDNTGNIWLGTYGGGVDVFNKASFKHLDYDTGYQMYKTTSILEDNNGKVWTNRDGISGPTIKTKDGSIWVATDGTGVFVFKDHLCTNYRIESGLSHDRVATIIEDKNGKIWMGTYGNGVTVFDGVSFTHFNERNGLSSNYVLSLMEDKEGNIWIGTYAGLSVYDGVNFTHYSESSGLSSNSVNVMLQDEMGNIWIGYYGSGISVFDGKNFVHYTKASGLSDDRVFSIVEDNEKCIWVGTEMGLTKFINKNLEQKYFEGQDEKIKLDFILKKYDKQDGVKNLSFIDNACFFDSKNILWWAFWDDVMFLDKNTFKTSTNIPKPYLYQIDINEQFIDYQNIDDRFKGVMSFDSVVSFKNYPTNLKLSYNHNHLTFHFAAIDWTAPHKIRYSFRVLGLDEHWSTPTSNPIAEYRNIPYGTYAFQIIAIGESGEWSEPFEYNFTINPPWWQSWWAYLGYTLLFLLALRVFSNYRERHLRAEKEKLEQTVEERTEELVQKNIIVEKEKVEADRQRVEADKQRQRSDDLLLNILPEEVAEELKAKGISEAKQFSEVTVLFTDFKEFTNLSEKLTPKELVADLNHCFTAFDEITHKHRIEKIKTIGDAYMAAGGLPTPNTTHAKDVVLAALEICDFIEEGKAHKIANNQPFFEIRIGIHTGPLVAGIVGVKKFQYDIWGDTVNTASRMESSGEVGKVNISQYTYELLKDDPYFEFEHRGKISAKGKGEIEMWFVSLKNKND